MNANIPVLGESAVRAGNNILLTDHAGMARQATTSGSCTHTSVQIYALILSMSWRARTSQRRFATLTDMCRYPRHDAGRKRDRTLGANIQECARKLTRSARAN